MMTPEILRGFAERKKVFVRVITHSIFQRERRSFRHRGNSRNSFSALYFGFEKSSKARLLLVYKPKLFRMKDNRILYREAVKMIIVYGSTGLDEIYS